MDKETIQNKLTKQVEDTKKYYELYLQSQGAVAILHQLLKECEEKGDTNV